MVQGTRGQTWMTCWTVALARPGWLVGGDSGGSWDLSRASAEKQPALARAGKQRVEDEIWLGGVLCYRVERYRLWRMDLTLDTHSTQQNFEMSARHLLIWTFFFAVSGFLAIQASGRLCQTEREMWFEITDWSIQSVVFRFDVGVSYIQSVQDRSGQPMK